MDIKDRKFEFVDHFKRASKDLKSSELHSVGWQPIYMELIWSLEHLLRQIVSDQKIEIERRSTLGSLRHQIGEQNIMPPVLFKSLDILISHRNMLAHARIPYESDAKDYLPDLDAVRNLILWYLSDFGSGPQVKRKEAENLLIDGLIAESKKGKTIFISYAREDEKIAVEVFDSLINRGHIPWMDKKELVAGQDWKLEIRKAIERSQYFVALMSEQSVTKKGFVQKELRFALDVLGEIPPGQIYFIPVRLEDCDVPDAIRSLHWVDVRGKDDFEQLFRAVEYE
jgi:hypothetical protein